MTTIAYRDGVLAADSRAMIGGWKSGYTLPKLFRLTDGSIAGTTGEYARGIAFIRWLDSQEQGDRPDLGDTTVVRLYRDGSLALYECGHSFPVVAEFAAWGSGFPPAMGALHAGASAKRAVEIAALVDDQTGGEVVAMQCEE